MSVAYSSLSNTLLFTFLSLPIKVSQIIFLPNQMCLTMRPNYHSFLVFMPDSRFLDTPTFQEPVTSFHSFSNATTLEN